MAVYKKDGAMVTAFANQKGYIAFYAGQAAIQAHKKELAGIDCGKGCIRYKTSPRSTSPWWSSCSKISPRTSYRC